MAKRTQTREPAAFSFRLIALLGGGLLLSLAIISAVLFATIRHPTSAQRNAVVYRRRWRSATSAAGQAARRSGRFQFTKKAILNEYAWVDRNSGVVRIPIDRAMNIVASRAPKAAEHSQ